MVPFDMSGMKSEYKSDCVSKSVKLLTVPLIYSHKTNIDILQLLEVKLLSKFLEVGQTNRRTDRWIEINK